MDELTVEQFGARLAAVRGRIEAAGGDPCRTSIVAVAKRFGPEAVLTAMQCGLEDIGENYAGELVSKATSEPLAGFKARWHYLGALQRNKLGRLSPFVHTWHGLSREVEVDALSAVQPGARVLVQVAFDDRQGCAPRDVGRLCEAGRQAGLDVAGLMTVAPRGGPDVAAAAFSSLAGLREALGLAELSMGMSGDFETAVRHGATMVRIGSALFGPRPAGPRMKQ
ncbi:MAG: alanine racemase [Actinomycetota bacterium]|nr:alanine racemase [Actinomycetota bacterium]